MDSKHARSSRLLVAFRVVVAFLMAAAAGGERAAATEVQRMVVAPGCYVLSPGKFYDVSAYCLDQSRAAPAFGSILSYVPADLDNAAIKVAGGSPMTLSEALAQHAVQIEGLGNRQQLRIINPSGGTVEICVKGPTVLIGNGETYAGDLERIREKIDQLLKSAGNNAAGVDSENGSVDSESRANVQRKLWDAVNAADEAETQEPSRSIPAAPLVLPETNGPSAGVPNRTKCIGDASIVKICLE
ncbi:MAG: hypothetical protein WAN51_03945 [Alphaproteobacteria bacterium]